MVPRGPKLDLRTSWRPSPALMLTRRASPRRCCELWLTNSPSRRGTGGGVDSYSRLGLGVEELCSRHDATIPSCMVGFVAVLKVGKGKVVWWWGVEAAVLHTVGPRCWSRLLEILDGPAVAGRAAEQGAACCYELLIDKPHVGVRVQGILGTHAQGLLAPLKISTFSMLIQILTDLPLVLYIHRHSVLNVDTEVGTFSDRLSLETLLHSRVTMNDYIKVV